MVTRLRVGSARLDITPDWPVSLAGFAARNGLSEGVAHPIHVRVAVLETVAEDRSRQRAVIVSADLLWWGPLQVPTLLAEVARVTDTSPDHVLLSATHSHSGPQTSFRASRSVGVAQIRVLAMLTQQTLAAAAQAVADLEEVVISRIQGVHPLGFNRRLSLNPLGAEDTLLTIIRFDRPDAWPPKALFVHYTCHPVISQESLISSEFPGVAMSTLEGNLNATCLFLQGCCGDINPDITGQRRTAYGTDTDVVRVGEELADAVLSLLDPSADTLQAVPLHAEHSTANMPFASLPTDENLQAGRDVPGLHGEWCRALLDHPEWRTRSIPLHLQRLDIADGLSLLAMNGEIVVDYALWIRSASAGAILPMGYANGMTGYVPTAQQIAEGGYEGGDASPYFFLPSPFAPAIETEVRRALAKLISTRTQTH